MAIDTEERAVANDTCGRISRGLPIMHRHEIGSMHRVPHRRVEIEPRGNRGHGDAVTLCALALRVAGRAQVALGAGLHAMFTQEVAIVNHVALRSRHLARQVHVTAAAVARVPLVFVGMAAEAGGMLDADVVRVGRDIQLSSHTVPSAFFVVRCMREAQMLARHLRCMAIPRAPVAVGARVGIMRIFVAFHALRGRREVHGPGLSGLLNARVAFQAIDAFDDVRSVLERPVLFVTFEAKHFRARPGGASEQDQGCD